MARLNSGPAKAGRPRVGVRISVRLPDDVLIQVDQLRGELADNGKTPSRAEMLRALTLAGLRTFRQEQREGGGSDAPG